MSLTNLPLINLSDEHLLRLMRLGLDMIFLCTGVNKIVMKVLWQLSLYFDTLRQCPGIHQADGTGESKRAESLENYAGPQCFAIPGNHDWHDGLETFIEQILHRWANHSEWHSWLASSSRIQANSQATIEGTVTGSLFGCASSAQKKFAFLLSVSYTAQCPIHYPRWTPYYMLFLAPGSNSKFLGNGFVSGFFPLL